MGFAEDIRQMIRDTNEFITSSFGTDPKRPLSYEESEKIKVRVGQIMTKLDSLATQLAAPPVVLPPGAVDPKTLPGGSHGSR